MRIFSVEDQRRILTVECLAREIWTDHYTPLIGDLQVDYMLKRFQSAGAIRDQIRQGYQYSMMADDAGNAIGYFAVQQQDQTLMLSKFYVRRQDRGKGFGRMMFAHIESLARDMGCLKIFLTVNKKNSGSIAVYKKFGFEIVRGVVKDIGSGFVMDDYLMEKSVNGF